VAARIEQRPLVMLAVDLDQSVAQLAEQSGGDGLVVDRGASTVFEMAASDVPALKSQLSSHHTPYTRVPGNEQYRGFAFPWPAGAAPAETLTCDSPKGDWLHVELYPIDADRVGVWMYTDWN